MFQYDNPFFQVIGKVVDYIFCSVLWVLFCLPVVTIGASTSALYYTTHKSLKGERGYVFKCFFGAFKQNFKCTVGLSIGYVIAFVFLMIDKAMFLTILQKGGQFGVMYYVFYFLQLYVVGAAIVTFAYVARFTCSGMEAFKKGLFLSFAYFPWLIAVIVITVVCAVLVVYSPILLGVLPALACWVIDWILERIFCRFMTPEELAEEKRLKVGKRSGK